MFDAFLQASEVGRRGGRRRRLGVVLSGAAHVAALVGFVAVSGSEPPAPPPVKEPIFLRLAPPRAAAVKAAPKVEPAPRPKPKAPRPAIVQPPPEIPPPQPAEEPVEEEVEEDAGVPEPAAVESTASSGEGRVGGLAGGTGDAVLELRDVARAPAVLHQVKPDYPREARWNRVEGLVVVRLVIGRDGLVERGSTRVVRSVADLDAAAVAAVEQWRFSPAIDHSGQVVRVAVEVPIRFTLR